ncbi:hypothetical protein SEA_COMRADE_160 [Streptomyces phage Comrade]|uniref:Uncharacterized protein n=2 Tax=Gilsonvirus comrade TaxID=2846395 RepID=A0A345ME67_9CAUD|nr:hypothetical protein HWB84_gp111 [Streptomyces phage Comrade]AXH68848.1 hypothetical protein SEA_SPARKLEGODDESS_162 [Streptomyces phage SparkleGoddess]AXQ63404.1 hypothetical protein SEA_COMRADE_160 [Streptomyces phage Comrade]UTN92392.1 hypothetical protein SEA_STIGMA_161 [Streptomyces phage Stigma]
MAGLPKKLYYVLIKPGGKPLGYGKKGGGKYTSRSAAESQAEDLKKQGVNVTLWESSEIDWTEVPISVPENQEPLW